MPPTPESQPRPRTPAGPTTWRISEHFAWVDVEADAVAIVGLAPGSPLDPCLILEPAAHLWREVSSGPCTRDALVRAGQRGGIASAEEAEDLADAFLEQLAEVGALVPGEGG